MALNIVADKDNGGPPDSSQPRRQQPGVKPAQKPSGPPPRPKDAVPLATKAEIEKWFAKTYLVIGIAIAMIRPMTSKAIIEQAEKCAAANAELCMEDKRIREAISKLMIVGKYGAVLTAHLPILLVAFAESRPEDKRETLLGFASILVDPEALLETLGGDDDDD